MAAGTTRRLDEQERAACQQVADGVRQGRAQTAVGQSAVRLAPTTKDPGSEA